MPDFRFIQNPLSNKWIILAPRRASRPDVSKGSKDVCPFCPGKESDEKEVYRIPARNAEPRDAGGGGKEGDSNWQVRVLPNKYPFAPIHEIIVHSPDHHKNFGELDTVSVELIFKAYRQRYQTNTKYGQVYIFHNRGEAGGESLPHPHSQLVVIPSEIKLEIQPPQKINQTNSEYIETNHFYIFCPETSEWPDEAWMVPKSNITRSTSSGQKLKFGDIADEEITDLSFSLSRLIQILSLRHGNEFPFNFYISPERNWYLRITPRLKIIGGLEIGTGVFVNTQDPKETISFIKEHFENPDEEKIKSTQQAYYKKAV